MTEPPADGSDDLQLVLSACKFLDLLLVLQTEDFQMCVPFYSVQSPSFAFLMRVVLLFVLRRHQWMFVTDTVDAVYKPDNWQPESMMDQLADVIGNLPVWALFLLLRTLQRAMSNSRAFPQIQNGDGDGSLLIGVPSTPGTAGPHSENYVSAAAPPRRPLLASVRRIGRVRDLLPFFESVGLSAYEGVYAAGVVDWDAVEGDLLEEMFDGTGA